MAKLAITHDQILRDLKNKNFAPVYLLMGEEPYYIDVVSDFIQFNVLDEMQREFDQLVLYGKDTDTSTIINAAKRFPMMAEKQVIIVKEAQHIKDLDKLQFYLQNVSASTILVICYKYGTVDGRRKWVADLRKQGVVFESPKLRDYEMAGWMNRYAVSKNLKIDDRALLMLTDFLGTDLSRVVNELDKLCLTLPPGSNRITPESVETNIGISKEFNVFELQDALIQNDVVKANRIVQFFADNKKLNPIQLVLGQLFNFFANLMLFHYLPVKNENTAAVEFKIHPFIARNYVKAAQRFSAWKTMHIISHIRETDARSKGFGNVSADDNELYKELIYKILH